MNKYIISMTIGILGLSFSGAGQGVQAGQVNNPQAPLVYEYNLKGPLSVESESISTTGTINAVTAFAEGTGELRLEVSANGGSTYVHIVNGAILSDGFIAGNQLRFKVKIGDGAVLKKITLGYTDLSGTSRMPARLMLSGFEISKPFYISGGSEDLFNYPLKIKPGKEITTRGFYFTAADKVSPLNYYLEDSENVWVKIPEIPKEGTLVYVYYDKEERKGEPLLARVPISPDGKKVFSFFDDFSGNVLDEKDWQARTELKGRLAIDSGKLKLTGASVITRSFKMKKGILEFKAMAEKNCAIEAILLGANIPQSDYPSEELVYSSAFPGAEHTIAINDVAKLNIGKAITPLVDYLYRVALNDSGIIFERYASDYTKEAEIRFLDSSRETAGYIGLKAEGALIGGGSVYFDWVRVRPYVESEPQVTGGIKNE